MADDLYSGLEASLGQLPEEVARGTRQHIQLLRQAGIASVEALSETIKNAASDPTTQLAACDLLGRLSDRYRLSAESLVELFARSERRELIWESAKALALMGVEHVAEALLPHLDSADPEKAIAAAWTLGRLRAPAAVGNLRALVSNTGLRHDVRAHAAEALGAIKSNDAVADLITALEDSSADVRYWAAFALGQIGDPEALPALQKLAQSDDSVVGTSDSVAAEAASAVELIRTQGSTT